MAPMINNISLKKDKFLNSILCIMFYILIAICILIFMNINSNNRIYINWDYFERWIILFFFWTIQTLKFSTDIKPLIPAFNRVRVL